MRRAFRPDHHLEVTKSRFFGSPSCGQVAVVAASFYNGWWRPTAPRRPPSFMGGTWIYDADFYNYGGCNTIIANDLISKAQIPLHDGAHYTTVTSQLRLHDNSKGAKTKLVKFYNSGGACKQMPCDGRRASIVIDEDGLLLGSPGTVVARTEQGFKYDLLPYPTMFDTYGKKLNVSQLFSKPGPFQGGCKLERKWNAYLCP